MLEVRPIDRTAIMEQLRVIEQNGKFTDAQKFRLAEFAVENAPTIEPEASHRKRCEFCKGRSFTNKPLTVITRTLKRVEVVFNFCPKCGRDMRVNDANAGRKEADEDAIG